MAKTLQIRAPKSMKLHEMSDKEVEKFVTKEAARMLEAMPKDIRPVGVNAVSIDSVVKGTSAEPGFWAEWTRACCDKRKSIDDYVDPVVSQFDPGVLTTNPAVANEHIETQMRVQTLSYPAMHKGKTTKK
jgi:hypothetical protein